jgi:hypothetical protein
LPRPGKLPLQTAALDEGLPVAALDRPENRAARTKETVEEWASESLLAAREAFWDHMTGERIEPGTKLGAEHYKQGRSEY